MLDFTLINKLWAGLFPYYIITYKLEQEAIINFMFLLWILLLFYIIFYEGKLLGKLELCLRPSWETTAMTRDIY